MKKVFLIAIFGFLSLTLSAQVSFDSAGYKAYQRISYSSNQRDTANSDILFWFAGKKVTLSTNDQTKNIYFVGKPIKETLKSGHKVVRIQCKDDGGFYCILSTGTDRKDLFISIEYNNIIFFYKVFETIERPWDNKPRELKAFEMRTEPYTIEEVDALIASWKNMEKFEIFY
jgi:hypothetical protein